jgi:hypothetical protein
MRRSVRRPEPVATTAPSNSSLCRLPFISAATALHGQLDGARGSRMAVLDRLDLQTLQRQAGLVGDARILASGPTSRGSSRPSSRLQRACKASAEQGWTTATRMGCAPRASRMS